VLNENSVLTSEEKWEVMKFILQFGQLRGIINTGKRVGLSAADALITASKAEFDAYVSQDANSQLYVCDGKAWWAHEKWSIRKSLKAGEFQVWNNSGIPARDRIDVSEVKSRTEWYNAGKREEGGNTK
jgi:hypothetical protein